MGDSRSRRRSNRVDPNTQWCGSFTTTDRQPTGSDDPAKKYSAERGEMTYGMRDVSIPRDHRHGRPGGAFDLEARFSKRPR